MKFSKINKITGYHRGEYLIPILYLHGKIITILNLTIICIILN